MALVLSLIMMITLTLIGLASIITSTFEMTLSGNKRGSTDAFYAADGGAQSVFNIVANFDVPGTPVKYINVNPNELPDYLKPDQTIIDKKYSSPSHSFPSGVQFTETPNITIYHTIQKGAPRGSGLSALHFNYDHFIIDSIGKDQIDSNLVRTTSRISEKIIRLNPTMQGGY